LIRSTQVITEILSERKVLLRSSQAAVEVLSPETATSLRSSQVTLEVLSPGKSTVLLSSQVALEVLSPETVANLIATQTLLEAISNADPSIFSTQVALEILSNARTIFVKNQTVRFRRKMKKGIRVPIGVNHLGGTDTVYGDEHKRQMITIALSSGESANAFQQDINLGVGMVFGQDGPGFRAGILRRLNAIFGKFEEDMLFRLMSETIAWSKGGDGELVLEFSYVDIESDKTVDFRKAFTVGV
jgi:hypothetical protein